MNDLSIKERLDLAIQLAAQASGRLAVIREAGHGLNWSELRHAASCLNNATRHIESIVKDTAGNAAEKKGPQS